MSMKDLIENALKTTENMLPKCATVACQGVEGAYSQLAATRIFKNPQIMYFKNFEGVCQAVDKGLCDFGVLPIENSTAGSVNAIYDLMMKYESYIVKSVRVKVDHSLLAKEGTKLEDVKEIYSHEQAILQCAEFLHENTGIKASVCENTAMAAKFVSESDRKDVAAISSRECAELYGLKTIKDSIQDKGNNYTRFICISKTLKIYPGADRTSIMATLSHKPGSLYQALKVFADAGCNLLKLESRPLADRDFEFKFYFDFETSVYDEEFANILEKFKEQSEEFRYLGSYLELV